MSICNDLRCSTHYLLGLSNLIIWVLLKKINYHGLLLSATKHPQAVDVYIGDLYGRLKWLFYGISVFISMIVVTGFVLIPQSHWIHFIYAIIFS